MPIYDELIYSANEKFKAVIASRVFEEVVMSEEKATMIMRQVE